MYSINCVIGDTFNFHWYKISAYNSGLQRILQFNRVYPNLKYIVCFITFNLKCKAENNKEEGSQAS